MPNPGFFPWGGASSSLLALPRPSSCPSIGCFVSLKGGEWGGPMGPCDYGVVLEDTGVGNTPFLVQELVSGRLWYYPDAALQRVPENRVPHDLRHPPNPGEGSYVTLVPDFKSFSDAGRGPLSLMRTEDAYGIVLMESGQRYRVRSCHTRGKDWWYDHGAVRPVHVKYVPEPMRASVRPAWGDYVALTSDHASFGAAADGPLEPGNLGVVVAVNEVPDAAGGLGQARYTVRSCHNAQSYRYQEGALHLVVQQLLHAPKIPPAGGKGRRRKLQFTMQVTEAGSGSAVPVGQVLLQGQGQVQQVALVTPGRKYWLAARLSCKDDDLMLANLKPCALNLYAQSGRSGSFLQLKPVPCIQQQQQQSQTQQGAELLSLAVCNGAAAAGAAAAGSRAWYNPCEDDVLCVFEWDSAETPLALKPSRVTEVGFVWGVCFSDLQGLFTKQYTLRVQAAPQASLVPTAAVQPAAAAATVQQGAVAAATAAAAGMADLRVGDTDDCSSDNGAHSVTLEWLGRQGGRRRAGSSSSSSSDDDEEGEQQEEDNEQAADSSSSSSEECAANDEGETQEEDTSSDEGAGNGNPEADGEDGAGGSSSSNAGGAQDGGGSSSSPRGGSRGAGFGGDGGAAGGADEGMNHAAAPPTPPAGVSTAGLLALPAAAEMTAVATSSSSMLMSASRDQAGTASLLSAEEAQQPEAAASGFAASTGSASAAAGSGRDTSSCPSTPDICTGRAASGTCGSSSSSAAAGGRGSNGPACGSSNGHSSRQQTLGVRRSDSSSGRDCERNSRRDQQPQLASGAGSSSSSSSTAGASSSCSSRGSTPSRAPATAAGVASRSSASSSSSSGRVAPSRHVVCDTAVLSGSVNIQEIMRQVQRQAESHQPLWQEGNESAQALAAKAMAAAEQFLPDNWRRPQGQSQARQ